MKTDPSHQIVPGALIAAAAEGGAFAAELHAEAGVGVRELQRLEERVAHGARVRVAPRGPVEPDLQLRVPALGRGADVGETLDGAEFPNRLVRETLEELTAAAWSVMDAYHADEQAGALTREQAQAGGEVVGQAIEAMDAYTKGHTERVAEFAVMAGRRLGFADRRVDRLRWAALIHDVGKLVLDRPVLNRKSVFDEFMVSGDKTFLSAENRILGFDHAEIGYDICQQWQIPESLAKAIRYHHRPSAASDDSLVCIVSMADTIANMAAAMSMAGRIQSGIDAVMYMVDDTVMARLALGEKDLGLIMEAALDAVEKIMLEIDPT